MVNELVSVKRLTKRDLSLKETDLKNILVVGLDSVALTRSAKRAGYNVFAVDYFGDRDLREICDSCVSITKQRVGKSCGRLEINFSPKAFLDPVKRISRNHPIDGILLSSGLEDSQEILLELDNVAPIIGNELQAIGKVRNKIDFFCQIQKLGINHPRTVLAKTNEEVRKAVSEIGYPILLKPLHSLGGSGITLARNKTHLATILQKTRIPSQGIIIQEHIIGKHLSTSFISTKGVSTVLSLNEQLLGLKEVGQREPFGYCGNIVPAKDDAKIIVDCKFVVEKIASHFNLLGSNGIDFVLTKNGDLFVIEVNPRFQGTLECVENYLGINLVKTHLDACLKSTGPPSNIVKSSKVYVRLIVFAPSRLIASNLSEMEEVRDIPEPGVIVEEGEPVCSIIAAEKNRKSALIKALTLATRINKSLIPVS